jgi:hypothetical protein
MRKTTEFFNGVRDFEFGKRALDFTQSKSQQASCRLAIGISKMHFVSSLLSRLALRVPSGVVV